MTSKTKALSFDSKSNVLYFGDKVDFRLTPKNVSTTVKIMWSSYSGLPWTEQSKSPHRYHPHMMSNIKRRRIAVKENDGRIFRPNTLKFAIKRDPLERWLSAVNWTITAYRKVREYGEMWSELDVEWKTWDINRIARLHRDTGIENIQSVAPDEFVSQYYCNDKVSDYDYVFDVKQFRECHKTLENILGTKISAPKSTVSNKIWTKKDLTSKSIDDIKLLYQDDYTNGWY